jgi:hypothetical protein
MRKAKSKRHQLNCTPQKRAAALQQKGAQDEGIMLAR